MSLAKLRLLINLNSSRTNSDSHLVITHVGAIFSTFLIFRIFSFIFWKHRRGTDVGQSVRKRPGRGQGQVRVRVVGLKQDRRNRRQGGHSRCCAQKSRRWPFALRSPAGVLLGSEVPQVSFCALKSHRWPFAL